MIRKQLTVCLPNKPGAFARAAQAMAQAEVNIEALSVVETTDVGVVRMLVSDVEIACRVLDEKRLSCIVEHVAVLPVEDRPGRLAEFAQALAREKINVHYMYGSTCEGGCKCRLVVSTSDPERVEALWSSAA